jgi:hypothetical protein
MSAGDLSTFAHKELVQTMCGKLLGAGAARQVYENLLDPNMVFKFETEHGSFQNIIEWETWDRVKATAHAKWFAPCIAISPCGGLLVQRRTTPAAFHPEQIPAFFTDLKCTNFGVLFNADNTPGHFVCHDYGVHLMLEKGMTKRMQKAAWWNL